MSDFVGPEQLTADHVREGFECGDESLDAWLIDRVLRNPADRSSRTWVVSDGGRVHLLNHFTVKSIEVAELIGVRMVLVHAKDSVVAAFYARFGFEPSPPMSSR